MRYRIAAALFLVLAVSAVWSQSGPAAFALPAGDRVAIILGDTSRTVAGFTVYRKTAGGRQFELLTQDPVMPVRDPFQARDLMGQDFRWIAGKIGSADPQTVWRRLRMDRNRTLAYCLISHGLRLAMGRTMIDETVDPGSRYTYRIVFLDAGMQETSRIDLDVLVSNPVKPVAPTDIATELDDEDVTVTWSYPSYQGGDDAVVGFHVYRSENGSQMKRLTKAPILRAEGYTEFYDDSVELGTAYRYGITSVDLIGVESDEATSRSIVPVDTKPPLVPEGITALDTEDAVLVLWNISPDLDVDHYDVYRSTRSNEGFEQINTEPIPYDNPRYIDTTVTRGVTHYYKISAIDASGNVSPAGGPTYVSPKDREPPGPVTGVIAEVNAEDRHVALQWNSSAEPDLRGYFVYRGVDEENIFRLTPKPIEPGQTPVYVDAGYLDEGLRPGKDLFYGVSAVDMSYNEGPIARISTSMPDTVAPDPPFSVSGRTTRNGEVVVTWMTRTEEPLSGFQIFRTVEDQPETIITTGSDSRSYTDGETVKGTPHMYRMRSIDLSGNESDFSDPFEITPKDIVPPAPPSMVTVRALDAGVEITWDGIQDHDVAGFYVYTARYRGARYRLIHDEPAQQNTWVFEDGVANHLYAVSAIDTSGNEGPRSMPATVGDTQ